MRPIYLVCFSAIFWGCSPSFEGLVEDKTSKIPLHIKSIRSYYIDNYGDQPDKDRKELGYILISEDAKVVSIKSPKRAYIEKGIQPVTNLIWFIDGNHYNRHNALLVHGSTYPSLFARRHKEEYEQAALRNPDDNTIITFELDNETMPRSLMTQFTTPDDDGKRWTRRDDYQFDYNSRGLLTRWLTERSTTRSGEQLPSYQRETIFEYNDNDLLALIADGRTTFSLEYEGDRVMKISVLRNDVLTRWYIFEYDHLGLRINNKAFNGTGDLEYSVEYEYEFYSNPI